ncbi:hypothetical protein SO694_00087152 [Aureococcus anophagefferens]|uniref:Uncharacterized protein n=1 Tax=Aureococcus anophagefferens TaxID=44056 RepID=A0ABR1G4H3_AURAN
MALVSTELVLRGADGDLTLREPAGDLAPPAVSPERDTKALRGDPACYARALEQTVEAQQQEIRRGRAAVDAAEAEALAARAPPRRRRRSSSTRGGLRWPRRADDRDRGAEARAACGGAVADVAAHAAGLAEESYLCVSVADVAAVADRADAARSACL